MWFRKKTSSSGITIKLVGVGEETQLVLDLQWPTPENLPMFTQMLVMLNRGMLISAFIKEISENDDGGASSVLRQLKKITKNEKNIDDKPHPVIPPDKVTKMEMKRLNGEF